MGENAKKPGKSEKTQYKNVYRQFMEKIRVENLERIGKKRQKTGKVGKSEKAP